MHALVPILDTISQSHCGKLLKVLTDEEHALCEQHMLRGGKVGPDACPFAFEVRIMLCASMAACMSHAKAF